MEHHYINDYHRQRSEAAQKEVAEMLKHPLSRQEMIDQIVRRNRNAIETSLTELSYIPDLQIKIGIILEYLSENKGVFKEVHEIQKTTNLNITEDETEEILMLLKLRKQVNRRYYHELGAVFKIADK